jgi:AcrR family transcriptional regulator
MTDASPRWNRLERDERRSQILAAARKLFTERRYSAVSTKDIAEEAGVARGLLNYYFGSKHDLYLEVTRDMLRVPVPPLASADTGAHGNVDLWGPSVDAWLDMMEANRDGWLAAVRAGEAGHDPELRAVMDEANEIAVERVLEALSLDSEHAPPALRAVVRSFGGLAQEAAREWLERGRLTRAQVRELLADVMPLIATEVWPRIAGGDGADGVDELEEDVS